MSTTSTNQLQGALDQRLLRRLAGPRSYHRGHEYCSGKRIVAFEEFDGKVTAMVRGTHDYTVELWLEDGFLQFSCSCPVGTSGAFCKHAVAVGLECVAVDPDDHLGQGARPADISVADVRAYVAAQSHETLVGMLMDHAAVDDRLRQRLLLEAAKKRPSGPDLATFRAAITQAVDPGDFVAYEDMYEYARGIENTIDAVEALLEDGLADEVVALSEHALDEVEDQMALVDDSAGHMGMIIDRLQELHLKGCMKAQVDPERLARFLFETELRSQCDAFVCAAETYAEVLGPNGSAEYHRLAEAEWGRVPELGPGERDPDGFGSRHRITRIMLTLARMSGDVERTVAVHRRDLSHAYGYIRIAEAYQQAQDADMALEWAERGLQAFPERTDSRLREFLAAEYHRRDRHDEAMDLTWSESSYRSRT